jgi:hypothetical protein
MNSALLLTPNVSTLRTKNSVRQEENGISYTVMSTVDAGNIHSRKVKYM